MSEHIRIGSLSGGISQVGGRGNSMSVGAPAPAARHEEEAPRPPDGAPQQALYAFADITGYSSLTARLQKISQDDLAALLDASVAEAGVRPELATPQDQGDARLLAFPAGTDAGRILAVLPRYFNDGLIARNRDMASHARMRVRLGFAMGAAVPAGTGLTGGAPIAAVRLANAAVFRRAMNEAPEAACGVIVDNYLHGEFVRLQFRPDMSPDDYVPVRVSYPDKGFEAEAWLRLMGYTSQQVIGLLA
jgi:hypothetical protein